MFSFKVSIFTSLTLIFFITLSCSSTLTPKELSYRILFKNDEQPNYAAVSAAIDARFPPGSLVRDLEHYMHSIHGGCGLYGEKELTFCTIEIECKYGFETKFSAIEGVIKSIKTTGGVIVCD